ncbi:MAG: hypothetical protein HC929_13430 [Leptolyngbyaceae cyanobacterium SM2_5_2]|nr:hypothetical protein [Leptolyngbyaceae cyanobacterium SM2_5_2]
MLKAKPSEHQLVDDGYQISQFRGNEMILSGLLPELRLTAEAVFQAGFALSPNPYPRAGEGL